MLWSGTAGQTSGLPAPHLCLELHTAKELLNTLKPGFAPSTREPSMSSSVSPRVKVSPFQASFPFALDVCVSRMNSLSWRSRAVNGNTLEQLAFPSLPAAFFLFLGCSHELSTEALPFLSLSLSSLRGFHVGDTKALRSIC